MKIIKTKDYNELSKKASDILIKEIAKKPNDGDWTYASVATPSTVVTTASRIAGPYSGQMVTMDQDGTYDNAAGAGPQEWN